MSLSGLVSDRLLLVLRTSAILSTINLGVLSAQPPIQLAPLRDWLTH
jgi:hypothetical protein